MNLHGSRALSTALLLIGAVAAASCIAPPRAKDVAVYASGTDLESANPLVTVHSLSRQVQRYALFVTLARYDSALSPVPYGARSWTWSADHRSLAFHLVGTLRWHDGRPTTARDVAFTVLAARDPATGYPRAADLAVVDTAVATDDSTVLVRFSTPQPSFPLVFCELPVLPRHLLSKVPHGQMRQAAFNLEPIGNGPFRFVSRTVGQRWVFARNDSFPRDLGGPPLLAGFVVAVVDEPTTKFAGLASGDLDVAGISPTMARLAARDPSLRVLDYPVLFTTGIVFNVHRPPFDDVRVRNAIGLSIDRRRIVAAGLAGYGVPAGGAVPPENPLALPGGPTLDVHAADSLLDAAGWRRRPDGVRSKSGHSLSFDLLTVGSGDNAIEQLVQSDLAARGVRMEIRQVELGAFLTAARASTKTFDALLTGISGDVSLAYLGAMFDSRQAGGSLDYAGFHTPALDRLFDLARDASSESARRDAWWAVQRELDADVPVAWIYFSRGLQGVSARLHGVRMDLRGEMVSLSRWQLSDSGARVAGAR